MAKQTAEEEFNLRRLTRRRLIGAIALVLVVVILLPIVFDSEPPAAGNGIELRIPNKDNAGDFQPKIDLPELDKMASEVAAASSAASVPAVVAESAVAVVPTPVVAPVPAVSQPKPEAKPVAKPQPKPVVKPQVVPKTGWAVQVGAFANADTARNLQAKLSKQGYHAYTEKAGNVVRVRVGGYPTREAAEKIESKLEAQGMQANVVTLD
ncbi:MAG: SPOR domain-containing protein [Aquabacterium sp.]|uniref:SPOR domain-containing protein n=1 Tax=Aquabacterium sp. TaxID=1872578 RepID=UPI002719B9C3|nr:SPOR domain-containing protein [Aquabacterium sp.]MDO9004983.1 SPOR domain-containing protein [Aquabacterium sp.]